MNGIPNSEIEVKNGGLGAAYPNGADVLAVVGAATSGPFNTPILVSGDGIAENFTSGPATDFANYGFQVFKRPVLFVRATADTAGALGTIDVTKVHGTTKITATGVPVDSFEIVFQCVKGGTLGTFGITFRVSLDGGRTFDAIRNLGTATTYAIPGTGVTLTLSAMTEDEPPVATTILSGDTATLTTTEPKIGDANLTAALESLRDTPLLFRCIHIVGVATPTTVEDTQDLLEEMADPGYRHTYAFVSARPRAPLTETDAQWATALATEYGATVAERMAVGAGMARYVSPTYGKARLRRPITWGAVALHMSEDVATSIAQVEVRGSVRPIPGCSVLSDAQVLEEHDERIAPGLSDARFITARTFLRESGVFITLPNILCSPGSDFSRVHLRAVMDIFCDTVQATTQRKLSSNVRLNKLGFINEGTAKKLEEAVMTALRKALLETGLASDVTYAFSRTDPLATPGTKLHGSGELTPLGYIEGIKSTLGFTNPAIAALQGA